VRKVVVGALGLLPALVALALGLGGAAGGHGWIGVFWFSIPLLLLYPLVFVRAFASKAETPDKDFIILAVGGAFDLLLAANMVAEREYVGKLWSLDRSGMIMWLALWAGWQVLGVTTALRRRHAGIGAQAPRS
jgi:hypothetical protein